MHGRRTWANAPSGDTPRRRCADLCADSAMTQTTGFSAKPTNFVIARSKATRQSLRCDAGCRNDRSSRFPLRQKSSVPTVTESVGFSAKPTNFVIARSEATRQSLRCDAGCRNDRSDTQAPREKLACRSILFTLLLGLVHFCFRMHVFFFRSGIPCCSLKDCRVGLAPSSQ